jgi:hypothetical protein
MSELSQIFHCSGGKRMDTRHRKRATEDELRRSNKCITGAPKGEQNKQVI